MSIESDLQKLLVEIMPTLSVENQLKLRNLTRQAQERRDSRQQNIQTIQESLDTLRLMIKYQKFDLEATRRENAYLRKMLEERPGPAGETGGEPA